MSEQLSAKEKAAEIEREYVTREMLRALIEHAIIRAEQAAKAEEQERCTDEATKLIAAIRRGGGE